MPWFLYELYGDTQTMSTYYDRMVDFVDYIRREKVTGNIVDAALADWVAADQTSGRITGTWGYHVMITRMSQMADLTGHTTDAAEYRKLADDIKQAFNDAFFNDGLGRYTTNGGAGPEGATQTAQALALDAGLVPDDRRDDVLNALVELVNAYHPNGEGPHFSGGTIGMAPIIRALAANRDDELWALLQEHDQPSYGYFMASTPANPGGMTTIGENWNRGASKNHMILAQIDEWFFAGLGGIRPATNAYGALVIQPEPVGDLRYVHSSYETPQGTARGSWTKNGHRFTLKVTVPANTTAEVWVPGGQVTTPPRATFQRVDVQHSVYTVPSGQFTFTATQRE